MNQLALALSACARVMRPVVKLAMAFGLKQQHLHEVVNDLLLDEAAKSWSARGIRANISQLSITTGINRKAVTTRVRTPRDPLASTELSAAAKTMTVWLEMATDNEALRTLPLLAEGKTPSFESMAWIGSRGNVHHRAVLEELVRLGMVVEKDHQVTLQTDAFVPATDLGAMLSFFADNGRDHLNASVSNILGQQPPMLERSVFAQGLSMEACDEIHQLVRTRWTALHHEVAHEMRIAVDAGGKSATARMRVGIYTYFEDAPKRGDTSSGEVPPDNS